MIEHKDVFGFDIDVGDVLIKPTMFLKCHGIQILMGIGK
jgi:hypothetical protein